MSTEPTSDWWAGIDTEDAEALLARSLEQFGNRMAIASSFSLEDAVVIDLAMKVRPDVRIFALDTGRLNPETYDCAEKLRWRYNVEMEWYFPEREAVEQLERTKGLFSFRDSIDNRKECCRIRKVDPLNRALKDLDAWVTGLRREQSVTREKLATIERDEGHGGIWKINPIASWTVDQLWDYTRREGLPYNSLYDRGYASIGCAPCTRAIEPGEDLRAGRWWWENPEHKECGLHVNMKQWSPSI